QSQFDAAVAKLDGSIPSLTDHQIEVDLAELVATLSEGHSRLSLPGLPDPMSDVVEIVPSEYPALAFHRLPVRFYQFSDGLFVIAATPEYRSLIGSRVVQIADKPAQTALNAVRPVINRDNDMGAMLIAPDFVATPEILSSVHVADDSSSVTLSLQSNTSSASNVVLAPLSTDSLASWIRVDDRAPNLSAEYEPASRTLLARIHVIQDAPNETVAQFAARLGELAGKHNVQRTVIDFRDCHGGDNQKFRALLLEIVRNEKVNRPGALFVLINRGTFSAAVNSASDLERLSNAIFIGEPTAGAPNSWGDPKRVTLPNSGLVARISTIYWRDWTTNLTRPWIAPDIRAPVSSADYFAGRDPAVAAALSFPEVQDFSGIVKKLIEAGGGAPSIVRLYYQRKNDPDWAGASTQDAMENAGQAFLARKSYDDAFLMFAINFKDYPDSLGASIQQVQSAQRAAPNDAELGKLAAKLGAMKDRH
ncbi:MAG TPA: hypothetical protein VGH02_13945, partial [Rhizomicrobium sp.]